MVMKPSTEEWERTAIVDLIYAGVPSPLLRRTGWDRQSLIVFDLQTGEGAMFNPHGLAIADLSKHAIWVCPLFPHFLQWLYTQPEEVLADIDLLPELIEISADFAMFGRRWADAKELATQQG